MNQVEKAIILAAGMGNRLHPLTQTIPKPLIPIHGICIVETIIQGLHANGIFDIYIVVGHLKEQFEYLKIKYSGIQFITNPYYETCNNISSLYVARKHLENSVILDGDQIIYNNKILAPSFERSGYRCIWTETPTKEWLLTTENGIIKHCSPTGGKKGWQLYSISYWNQTDGKKLKHHLEREFFHKKNTQIYWDNVPMFCYAEEYQLGIYPMNPEDVIEIDTLSELAAIDSKYSNIVS